MSYNDKIAQARTLLESHNEQLPESDRLNIEEVFTDLRKSGGTTEDALGVVTWEDLMTCGVPRILARTIATAFRAKSETDAAKPVTKWQVSSMSSRDLIHNYDPNNEAIVTRLKGMSKDKPFIIFDEQGKVVEDLTLNHLLEIQRGYAAKTEILYNAKLYRTYKAGEQLDELCDENPLFPGEALRPDGTCDRTGFKWDKSLPFAVRQILYLAVKNTREIVIEKIGDAHIITDFIANSKPENLLFAAQMRYKEAAILLLGEKENPKLKVSLKDNASNRTSNRKDDPFYYSNK